MTDTADQSQRIDRWLWHARIFKTRTLAGKVVASQGARITRHGQTQRTDKPSFSVRVGDIVALSKGVQIIVLEIAGIGDRRGPAPEAQALYVDRSPPSPPKLEKRPAPFVRDEGTGRPTKKDRRALDALRVSTMKDQ
ncbi:MAG: RNA-binding S4 domain-containing protein [Pseudomonadota bacterium]